MEKNTSPKTAEAGNYGDKVRSDCHIRIETGKVRGLEIFIKSKVASMYGRHLRSLITGQLKFYGLENARIELTDSGALDFVIMARLEAAVRQLMKIDNPYLPEMLPENNTSTERERPRLSRLYLPGDNPALMINAGIHRPHGIILDLEDSVAPDKKDEARLLVRNALRAVNFYDAERMVRINPLPTGESDLKEVINHNVHVILIPKTETPEQIREIESIIDRYTEDRDKAKNILFMPIIESALGVENAFSIATSSDKIAAMAIGLEDFTADLGVGRTEEGNESLWARSRIVNACVAAGIQPIDSVYSDVSNTDGLLQNVRRSKAMGFAGMGCIHPRQIRIIHEGFKPEKEEIIKAYRIREAWDKARQQGLGVVSLGTKMVDAPVVKRALHTLNMAESMGMDIDSMVNEQ